VKQLRFENGALDAVDLALIEALVANARISTAALARRVGLSGPTVSERIRRLEDAGVIKGYAARIDPKALGLSIAAWIRIRPLPGELKRVTEFVGAMPEIVECDRITGEDCLIAKACVRTIGDLERLIDAINPCAMTNTSIIQSSPVQRRAPTIRRSDV
jgi:Lrp/AsnC family leucine-responsive transcriptional regulator